MVCCPVCATPVNQQPGYNPEYAIVKPELTCHVCKNNRQNEQLDVISRLSGELVTILGRPRAEMQELVKESMTRLRDEINKALI